MAAKYLLLAAQLRVLQDRLDNIKSMPPYTFADKLADAEWVHRRTQELKKEIEDQQAVRKAYDEKYRALKED